MDAHLTPPTNLDCVVFDEETDVGSLLARRVSRRRGLKGLLVGGATALVGGMTAACGVLEWAGPPLNPGGGVPTTGGPSICTIPTPPPCCGLATCIECAWEGSKDQYTCPEGWQPAFWTCIDPVLGSVVCGECATSSSCFSGPFPCSIWY